jgi:hypothetical protein
VDDFLREVASVEKDVTQVTCTVGIDVERKLYEVEFRDRSRRTIVGTLYFRNTSELVKTLRQPVREGSPLRIKRKTLVMWDHQKDIQYLGCELMREGKREIVSVSFLRPLVYRSRFYPEKFKYPQTCSDLLSTKKGRKVTLVFRPEDNNRFRLILQGLSAESSLKKLEELRMDVFEMALLAECEQFIDTDRWTRHDAKIDASQLSDLRFSQIDNYPRLKEAISKVVTDMIVDVSEAMDRRERRARCRLTLEKRDGKDVAVIKGVESGKEIDSFPIEIHDFELLKELMMADGGPLTYYDVENLEQFYENAKRLKSTEKEEESL